MNNHIGIAAVSPTGAALFYQALSKQAAAHALRPDELRITFHNEPLDQYLSAIKENDWNKVGLLLRRSAELVARCGAKFCLSPDAAVQQAIQFAEQGSPIPWLSMTDIVAAEVAKDGRKKVGIIGTRLVMESSTFQIPLGVRGVHVVPPDEPDRVEIDRIIFEELIKGTITAKSMTYTTELFAKLKYEHECEAIILAGSETPLLITPDNKTLPVYDAASLLATEAVQHANTMVSNT